MMRRIERHRSAALTLTLTVTLTAACGGPGEPRFAEVTVSSVASTATLSGSTHGVAAAIELSAGCPGYLDPAAPEHVIHLEDATPITITARSQRGPLALAISGEDEVRCDSDGGSGHAPHVTITAPGDYAVHVASLRDAADLPYELAIAPAGTTATTAPPGAATERSHVSVTVTSDPAGATVRTPEGQVLGTTPAMFVVTIAPSEVGSERRYILEMPGRPAAEVSGRLIGGAVVLHATLGGAGSVPPSFSGAVIDAAAATGPELVGTASRAQPIRDHSVARQSLEVTRPCTIARATVDVDIRHSFIADLRVVLRSPSGTAITLHNHSGGGRANLVTSFDWTARRGALQALAGENARGRWEMAVHDDAGADTGTFRSFTLHLGCREGGATAAASTTAPPPTAAASEPRDTTASATSRRARTRTRRRVMPQPPVVRPRVLDPFAGRAQPPQPPPQPWQSPSTTGRTNGGRTLAPFE